MSPTRRVFSCVFVRQRQWMARGKLLNTVWVSFNQFICYYRVPRASRNKVVFGNSVRRGTRSTIWNIGSQRWCAWLICDAIAWISHWHYQYWLCQRVSFSSLRGMLWNVLRNSWCGGLFLSFQTYNLALLTKPYMSEICLDEMSVVDGTTEPGLAVT